MKTIIENGKDVAEPDQIASGMAGTGQKNIAWSVLARGLGAVNIGELDGISCTTPVGSGVSSARSHDSKSAKKCGM